MLRLIWLSRQSCQKKVWAEFDPSRQSWIVSDRKTKFFLTRDLLKKHSVISEPVRRAKEFWKEILRFADPEMRCLEELGSRVAARDFLALHGKSEWCKRPHAPQRLLNACQDLAALLTHPDVDEKMGDYVKQFDETASPFVELVELGVKFYGSSLEQKRLPRFFLPFYLAGLGVNHVSERTLVFDLGFDLKPGERELIQLLSKNNDVTVVIPCPDSAKLDECGLHFYKHFDLGVAQVTQKKIDGADDKQAPVELWRCSSPESEARKAVELVAKWVSAGVAPERIAIAADKFSNYENILSHDLEWEGIGLHRRLQTVLSASRLFRALNARLQVTKGTMRAAVLEEAFLSVAVYKGTLRRRRERAVLRPILREDQIPEPELREKIKLLQQKKKDRMNVVEFEALVIDLFKDLAREASAYEDIIEAQERNELFLRALQSLRSEIGDAQLELVHWIEAWQEVTNGIKLPVKQPVEEGVWGVDLSSVEEVPADHLIVLGCLESPSITSVAASLDEKRLSFLSDIVFDLKAPSKNKIDPFFKWILSGPRQHVVLSSPKTDSKGKAAPANPLWLKLAAKEKKGLDSLDFARHTRWLDVQKTILRNETAARVDKFKQWPEGTAEKMGVLVTEELLGTRKIVLPEQPARPLPVLLSASRIEAYWECPFKFFARAYLGLFDEEDLEVEPSPQKRGQWLHSAVEIIMASDKKLAEWTDEELAALIDSLDEVQRQVSSDVWPSIRSRFVRQLRRFIQFEANWQREYPRAKPAGLEAELRGVLEWPQEKPEIKFEPTMALEEETPLFWAEFKGSVDRIDVTAQNQAIILDYKNSASAATNIPSWPENGNFQLALYSEAVEAGLWREGPKPIVAAQYYTLRNPQREKGFKLVDADLTGVLPQDGNPRAAVNRKERDDIFKAINEQVHAVLEKIRLGEMTPAPHSDKLCPACSWRTSCRAPHLS